MIEAPTVRNLRFFARRHVQQSGQNQENVGPARDVWPAQKQQERSHRARPTSDGRARNTHRYVIYPSICTLIHICNVYMYIHMHVFICSGTSSYQGPISSWRPI